LKSGFIAIVGPPNVGKSTLLNRMLGEKVAIVSPRPQTTRTQIKGILNLPAAQLVFIDTPGIHLPHHLLGENLVKMAVKSLKDVDLRLFVVDASLSAGEDDKRVAGHLEHSEGPVLLVLNKIDKFEAIDPAILESYQSLLKFEKTVLVSARSGAGQEDFLKAIVELLPEGPQFYDPEEFTDQTERVLAAELIREQVIRYTGDELPHSVAVKIEEFKDRPEVTYIRAHLFVERDSQQGIVVGAGGRKIKEIGQNARLAIEEMTGRKVYLDLQVKVLKNWRKDALTLKRLGYAVD
jgi:GTP-binding protein Era